MSTLRQSLVLFALLTLLTGVVYPSLLTGAAQLLMADSANGSLIERGGRVVGSTLIGQPFVDEKYFAGRPSSTKPIPYDASAAAGSNLGPTNPVLKSAVNARVAAHVKANAASATTRVPVDLVTASGSGLDPHVSPAAARYQVARVARLRGLPEARVQALVDAHVEPRVLGVIGEPRVNVLLLNLALDDLSTP
jgi:K+-transporting ATPase ATPase C chain